MQLPVLPSEIMGRALGAARDRLGQDFEAHLGEVLIGTMLRVWDVPEVREAFLGLLRAAATTEQGLVMLREFVTSTIVASMIRGAGLPRRRREPVPRHPGGQPGRRPGLHQAPAAARADRVGEPSKTWSPRSAPPCSAT